MLRDFYGSLAQVSFTVLGLWLVVIQLRRREWRSVAWKGYAARAVVVDLALPGMMSLFSLAGPGGSALWRVAFVVFATVGAAGMALLSAGNRQPQPVSASAGPLGSWPSIVLYAAIGLVAILAGVIRTAVAPLQVEAVLLSLLLLVGLYGAVSQLFAADTEES